MDRTTLTRDQAQAVSKVIRAQLGYLFKLRERMRAAGFPHDDPLLANSTAVLASAPNTRRRLRSDSDTGMASWGPPRNQI